MKKKEMLKEQKKLKNDRRELMNNNNDFNGRKILVVTLSVVGFILVLFLFMNIIKGDINLFNRKNEIQHEIDPRYVLCGNMLNVNDEEYYVLAYDINNKDHEIYSALFSKYYDKKLYVMDMGSGLNSVCIGEKKVINNDISKLKLNEPTLLKIKKNKIVSNFVTSKNIDKELSK